MEHTGKRALVLAGGGAKGSYQIGVWHALQALDWTPDIITGASVGTLNGCLFTMGKAREAEELWRSLEIHDVLEVPESLKHEELRAFFLDIFRSGGLNVEPLAETIDRLIDEDAVRHSAIHFGLVIAVIVVVVGFYALYKSPWGYGVRMTGLSAGFAKFQGIGVAGMILTASMAGGFLAAAQLLDFRLRRSKIAARALELEAQHDHRDQEHQRKRQQSHKKHIKRIAPRFAAADPTSFHK